MENQRREARAERKELEAKLGAQSREALVERKEFEAELEAQMRQREEQHRAELRMKAGALHALPDPHHGLVLLADAELGGAEEIAIDLGAELSAARESARQEAEEAAEALERAEQRRREQEVALEDARQEAADAREAHSQQLAELKQEAANRCMDAIATLAEYQRKNGRLKPRPRRRLRLFGA